MRAIAQGRKQELAGRGRAGDRRAAPDFLGQVTASQRERGLKLRVLDFAEAGYPGELGHVGGKQRAQPLVQHEQLAGEIECAFPARSGAQENRQQLGIGQRLGAARNELFPRALALGPIADTHRYPSLYYPKALP